MYAIRSYYVPFQGIEGKAPVHPAGFMAVKPKIKELIEQIENHLDDKRRGERLRNA